MIAAHAIVYALLSPVLVTLLNDVSRRRLLFASLALFAAANVAAVVLLYGPPSVLGWTAALPGLALLSTRAKTEPPPVLDSPDR